jgi:hypothetical protein
MLLVVSLSVLIVWAIAFIAFGPWFDARVWPQTGREPSWAKVILRWPATTRARGVLLLVVAVSALVDVTSG